MVVDWVAGLAVAMAVVLAAEMVVALAVRSAPVPRHNQIMQSRYNQTQLVEQSIRRRDRGKHLLILLERRMVVE